MVRRTLGEGVRVVLAVGVEEEQNVREAEQWRHIEATTGVVHDRKCCDCLMERHQSGSSCFGKENLLYRH